MKSESSLPNVLKYFPKSGFAANSIATVICSLDALIFYIHDYKAETFRRWNKYTESSVEFLKNLIPAIQNVAHHVTENPKIYGINSPFFDEKSALADAVAINFVAHLLMSAFVIMFYRIEYKKFSSELKLKLDNILNYWELYSIILIIFIIILEYTVLSGSIYEENFLGQYPLKNYYVFIIVSFLIFYMTYVISATGTAIFLSIGHRRKNVFTEDSLRLPDR